MNTKQNKIYFKILDVDEFKNYFILRYNQKELNQIVLQQLKDNEDYILYSIKMNYANTIRNPKKDEHPAIYSFICDVLDRNILKYRKMLYHDTVKNVSKIIFTACKSKYNEFKNHDLNQCDIFNEKSIYNYKPIEKWDRSFCGNYQYDDKIIDRCKDIINDYFLINKLPCEIYKYKFNTDGGPGRIANRPPSCFSLAFKQWRYDQNENNLKYFYDNYFLYFLENLKIDNKRNFLFESIKNIFC